MAQDVTLPQSPPTTAGGALSAEIANVLRNPFIRPFGGILPPGDPTLRMRGAGWNWEIYDRAAEDPRVYSALQKRMGALAAYPYQLDAATKDPADVAAKELVERALTSFPTQRVVKDLLQAINKGFSVVEIMWDVVDGEIMPVGAYRRDQRRFRFGQDYKLRLIDWNDLIYGTPVPDRKFVVHTHDRHDGDPYGRGLGVMLFWLALFKRQNLASWLVHNDKFASPTAYGKHAPEASQEVKDALLSSCSALAIQTAVITDNQTSIELLQAQNAGGADTYGALKESLNDDISEVVLGSTFAANAGALDGGSGARADTDDRLELARSDAGDLAETFNGTLVKWIVELNMPGAKPPVLKWLIDEEEDLTARAEIDDKIRTWGYKPTLEYILERYGGEWSEQAPPVPPPNPFAPGQADPGDPSNPADPPAFAEAKPVPPGTLATAAFAQAGADKVKPVIAGWVDQVRKLAGQVGSLDELRDRLIELYPTMSGGLFAEVMGQALQVADLTGRYEAGNGG
jgi:phage gp29-like protein